MELDGERLDQISFVVVCQMIAFFIVLFDTIDLYNLLYMKLLFFVVGS